MQTAPSVFGQVLQHVPWGLFAQLVAGFDADRRVRRLSTRDQLVGLLFAQLCGATSLREIEAALASPLGRLWAPRQGRLCRATLADANARRPSGVFVGLLSHMAERAGRCLRRATRQKLRLIDATSVRLAGQGAQWAQFARGVQSAKAHIVFDPDAGPLRFWLTPAKVNDIVVAKTMVLEAGATFVFDLGYYDFGWWAEIDKAGCRFVTRLKKNTALHNAKANPVPPGSPVLGDRIGHLPDRQAKRRTNPFTKPVREVRVLTQTGKELRVLTNDLEAPAEEIASLYKQRWGIELFFRWIKQTLRVKHFLGRSQNAVCIQLAVALIAFVLVSIAKAAAKSPHSLLACARLLRINMLAQQTIKDLFRPPKPKPKTPNPNRATNRTTVGLTRESMP